MNRHSPSDSILVIGYGNALRGDDGLGPHVVGALDALGLAQVRTRIVQQLLPELTEELAETHFAIFVDARLGSPEEEVSVASIWPVSCVAAFGHTADPCSLLALTQGLYGRVPDAWLVSVPGLDFTLGEQLSAYAQGQARMAIDRICKVIESCRQRMQ